MQVSVEPILPQPVVYILGAGHIGFAVAKIAKIAGFKVTVVDDRPAYANKERFPDADKILVEEPADSLSKININKLSYLVIACRGHLEDQQTLIEALKTNAFYIGLLGSKKKVKTIFANMVKEGVPQESLKRIHAPIGVPIATDTPEEIAISIVAEIVDVRRQNKKKINAAE
jgi:xanthine dehydrogenase accessory factor